MLVYRLGRAGFGRHVGVFGGPFSFATSQGVASRCWEPSQSGMYQPISADLAEHPLTPDTPVSNRTSGLP